MLKRLSAIPIDTFHQIQLVVCAVIASRLARDADEADPASTPSAIRGPQVGEEP
jgi:sodium/bile acid cotransporter 7